MDTPRRHGYCVVWPSAPDISRRHTMIRDLARRLARRGTVHACATISVSLALVASARAEHLDGGVLLRAPKAMTSRIYCRAEETWGGFDSMQGSEEAICAAP